MATILKMDGILMIIRILYKETKNIKKQKIKKNELIMNTFTYIIMHLVICATYIFRRKKYESIR